LNNIENPDIPVWNEIAATVYTVVGGAAGFVDTDISASLTKGIAFFVVYPAGAQAVGVRSPGSLKATNFNAAIGVSIFAGVAKVVAGHVEFYRSAADNAYILLGYLNQ